MVTRHGIYEHTDPVEGRYRSRRLFGPQESVPVRYAGASLGVEELLAPT